MFKKGLIVLASLLLAVVSNAGSHTHSHGHSHINNFMDNTTVILGLDILSEVGVTPILKDEELGIGYVELDAIDLMKVQELAHDYNRCGGFEIVESDVNAAQQSFNFLHEMNLRNQNFNLMSNVLRHNMTADEGIVAALEEVSPENLKDSVEWLTSFNSRRSVHDTRNEHVVALQERLEKMIEDSETSLDVEVSLVDHGSRTKQNTVAVKIEGTERPDEIIVLGGHLDSTVGGAGGGGGGAGDICDIIPGLCLNTAAARSPGADDNASGSSNLIEALRILLSKDAPKRSIHFFWYAAEEEGLVGSADIAKKYKKDNADVIAVLQLDMTLFAGSGEFTLGTMTDFTSSWLRNYLEEINDLYIGGEIVKSKCGYGCSDHASWHRQGFPALMPFESSFDDMNGKIHTKNDTIANGLNFEHSAMFTKIALVMAMDLGNSEARQPEFK